MVLEISRSEQKRRIKLLEKLVEELGSLSGNVLKSIPCNAEIKKLLLEVITLKGGAKNRQLKYITKMLKEEPVDELYDFLSKRKGNALQENRQVHEIEYFRDSLLNEALEQHRIFRSQNQELAENWSSEVIMEIQGRLPEIDTVTLKRLSNHFARTRNRRHSREIFRLIKAAMDEASQK
jgi:ribosome-associated protein